MNYLSHYFFFHKKDQHYFNCGLIFPDWIGTYHRNRLHRNLLAESEAELELKSGIELHYYADRTFHGSPYFTKHAHGIKLILEKTTLNKDQFRFTFLSHVLLEMMIDRVFLRIAPETGNSFYDSLDACDDEILLYFAQKNSKVDAGFKELISRFRGYRFILSYSDNERFIYSLSRIASRVGIALDAFAQKELIAVTDEIENYIKNSMNELFDLFGYEEK